MLPNQRRLRESDRMSPPPTPEPATQEKAYEQATKVEGRVELLMAWPAKGIFLFSIAT